MELFFFPFWFSRNFSSPANSFLMFLSVFCYVLLFAIFCFKIVCFLVTRLLVCLCAISPLLARRTFYVVLECPVLSVFLSRFDIFQTSFFRQYLLVYFNLSYLFFLCCLFFFLSQHVPSFSLCFVIFASRRRFLICFSSRIPHSGFDFL